MSCICNGTALGLEARGNLRCYSLLDLPYLNWKQTIKVVPASYAL